MQQKSGMTCMDWQHRKQFWSSKPQHASVGGKTLSCILKKSLLILQYFLHILKRIMIGGKPLNANFWWLSFHWNRKLEAKWWAVRAEEGTQMSLLALMSRTSSLGPGSATERLGHLPLQKFNETKGISVTLRKEAFMEVFVELYPFIFVFSISFFLDYQSLSFRKPCSSSFLLLPCGRGL